MTALPKKKHISPKEYLDLENASLEKNEYFNGEIFQMAGASEKRNKIAMNIGANLHFQIRKRPCKPYQNDMRLFVEASGFYTYPDVMVTCEKPNLKKYKGLESLTNPMLIVEVQSPSTADYDKGAKFDHYRTLESLQEYVRVWQDKKRVALYTKQADDSWLLRDFIGAKAEIELKSIECRLAVEDIYEKVEITE